TSLDSTQLYASYSQTAAECSRTQPRASATTSLQAAARRVRLETAACDARADVRECMSATFQRDLIRQRTLAGLSAAGAAAAASAVGYALSRAYYTMGHVPIVRDPRLRDPVAARQRCRCGDPFDCRDDGLGHTCSVSPV